ncbi:MAG: hypothetical protein HC905_26445, partial [Bacteroidales bacterium]|nr:hypothetical protein [Bacteroidales bacterium]
MIQNFFCRDNFTVNTTNNKGIGEGLPDISHDSNPQLHAKPVYYSFRPYIKIAAPADLYLALALHGRTQPGGDSSNICP